LKAGWKPNRTIVLCSWDGEEYGLIGSTEWGEENANELTKDAIAYINVDAPVSGTNFGASSVPSLDKFIMDVTKSVNDPKTEESVFDAWYTSQNKSYFEEQDSIPDSAKTTIGRLGSGSDYTVFLEHLGIPSFDFGFGGPYGVYHSALDNFYWMEHWGDPTFQYHAAVAKLLGIAGIRLADDSLLPFRYSDYAKQIHKYINEFEKKSGEIQNLKPVDFTSATNATIEFEKSADEVDSILAMRKFDNYSSTNAALMEIERAFTDDRGLPQSQWFKHQIYAPGAYSGYASEPLPAIARAIEKQDGTELHQALQTFEVAIKKATLIEGQIIKESGE